MVTTNSPEMAERLRMLRVHGSKQKYFHQILGTNSRLDALQAAILRVKLRHLEAWAAGRRNRADRYRKLFSEVGVQEFIAYPPTPPESFLHVYNQFTIRCQQRDELKTFLSSKGLPSEIYYPLPLHLQPAFKFLGHREGDMPQAEEASHVVLSLPVYPELSDAQQDLVVQTLADFYRNKG